MQSDPDGTISRVEFRANGTLLGTSTASPYAYVWDHVSSGSYSITATAVDNQGAATTTAPMTVSVGGAVDVNLASGLDGATVADDNVLVRGTVSAPPNSAMTVNGIVTHIDDAGHFQANDVPLAVGANTVTAVVTTQDGQTSSRTITLNSTGRGPFVVHAAPAEGLNSLTVAFTVENPDDVAVRADDIRPRQRRLGERHGHPSSIQQWDAHRFRNVSDRYVACRHQGVRRSGSGHLLDQQVDRRIVAGSASRRN